MSHAHGTYLGGVRSVECLRQRSRICAETGCWLWSLCVSGGQARVWVRSPAGSAAPNAKLTGLQAAWRLGRPDAPLQAGQVLWRRCGEGRCVNPLHVSRGTTLERGAWWRRSGRMRGNPARTVACIKVARAHRGKLSMDAARQIRASTETQAVLAARFNVSQNAIHRVKAGKSWLEAGAPGGVFGLGAVHGW